MRRSSLLVLALALVATSCGGGGEDGPTPTPLGTPPQAEISRENKLPDNFPTDFPLPDDREVVFSQKTDTSALVYFDAPASDDELRAFFASALPEAGWKIQQCQSLASPAPLLVIVTNKDPYVATISVGRFPGADQGFEGDYKFFVALIQGAGQLPDTTPPPCP